MLLLFATLLGSYFNIPIAVLPPEKLQSDTVIDFFGMQYAVPVVENLRRYGGRRQCRRRGHPDDHVGLSARQPAAMGARRDRDRHRRAGAALARPHPVPGVGIAVPVFFPAIVTAVVALLLSRRDAAPLAYIGGSMGTLIGADLTNLDKVRGLGAPVASIGGAGTFDGIFLTGILAVLLAGLYHPRQTASQP